jgi:hypothetical protein
LEHNQIIDQAKTSSKEKEDKEFKQAKETQGFNPKFTPTKDATSLLRIPQRKGYHQDPLFLFQPSQKKIGAH